MTGVRKANVEVNVDKGERKNRRRSYHGKNWVLASRLILTDVVIGSAVFFRMICECGGGECK
jgi:hypothetical protein